MFVRSLVLNVIFAAHFARNLLRRNLEIHLAHKAKPSASGITFYRLTAFPPTLSALTACAKMPITNETARKPQRTFRFPQFDPSLSALKPAPLSIVKVAKMASTEEEPVIQESHLQQESVRLRRELQHAMHKKCN